MTHDERVELAECAALEDGWIEGALAPLPETVSNITRILETLTVAESSITPNDNGTITAEWIHTPERWAYLEVGLNTVGAIVKRTPLESVYINTTVEDFPSGQFAELVTALEVGN